MPVSRYPTPGASTLASPSPPRGAEPMRSARHKTGRSQAAAANGGSNNSKCPGARVHSWNRHGRAPSRLVRCTKPRFTRASASCVSSPDQSRRQGLSRWHTSGRSSFQHRRAASRPPCSSPGRAPRSPRLVHCRRRNAGHSRRGLHLKARGRGLLNQLNVPRIVLHYAGGSARLILRSALSPHLVLAAFLAISALRSGVMFFARAAPPLRPRD